MYLIHLRHKLISKPGNPNWTKRNKRLELHLFMTVNRSSKHNLSRLYKFFVILSKNKITNKKTLIYNILITYCLSKIFRMRLLRSNIKNITQCIFKWGSTYITSLSNIMITLINPLLAIGNKSSYKTPLQPIESLHGKTSTITTLSKIIHGYHKMVIQHFLISIWKPNRMPKQLTSPILITFSKWEKSTICCNTSTGSQLIMTSLHVINHVFPQLMYTIRYTRLQLIQNIYFTNSNKKPLISSGPRPHKLSK